jgi:hypothetical protein
MNHVMVLEAGKVGMWLVIVRAMVKAARMLPPFAEELPGVELVSGAGGRRNDQRDDEGHGAHD